MKLTSVIIAAVIMALVGFAYPASANDEDDLRQYFASKNFGVEVPLEQYAVPQQEFVVLVVFCKEGYLDPKNPRECRPKLLGIAELTAGDDGGRGMSLPQCNGLSGFRFFEKWLTQNPQFAENRIPRFHGCWAGPEEIPLAFKPSH